MRDSFKLLVHVALALATVHLGVDRAGAQGTGTIIDNDSSAAGIDFAILQFPPSISVAPNTATPDIFAQIYERALTDGGGQSANLIVQLGYSPSGTNPATDQSWVWTSATFNTHVGNNAEYRATFNAPKAPGQYAYTYRVGISNGDIASTSFTYADLDGCGTNPGLNFNVGQLGSLAVIAPAGVVSINDVRVVEGGNGRRVANFIVTRKGGDATFEVDYATIDGTAIAGLDYIATAGQLKFEQGEMSKSVQAVIIDDSAFEPSETFSIELSNATGGATIAHSESAGVDFAILQFPPSLSTTANQITPQIFGRVHKDGITEAAGASAKIVAQLGYGPTGTDPMTDTSWVWTNASFGSQVGKDDEYFATIVGPNPGIYAYTFRFAILYDCSQSSAFAYADRDGNGANEGLSFSTDQLGNLLISP